MDQCDEIKNYLNNICFFCGKNNPLKIPLPSDPAEVAKIQVLTGRKFNKIKDGPQTMCLSCAGRFNEFNEFYRSHLAVEAATRKRIGLNFPPNNSGESSDDDSDSVQNVTSEEKTDEELDDTPEGHTEMLKDDADDSEDTSENDTDDSSEDSET